MNQADTFQQFLLTQGAEVPLVEFLINLVLASLLATILSVVYVRYGTALSNRRWFARNLLLLTLTTTLVITVVKSSLALSLGLVGALSIVRFRAAIKEPEELTYLFFAIAIGLGLGANQRAVTLVALLFVVMIVIVTRIVHGREQNQNLFLTVSSSEPGKIALPDVLETLNSHCRTVDLRRFDETPEVLEASFLVEFEGFRELENGRVALQTLGESVNVSFVDNKGLA